MNVAQLIVNIAITGSLYLLMATGLTLVYRILKFANFAHAEFITFGAYVAYVLNSLGLNIYYSAIFAFIATGLLGIVCDILVFRQLRARGSSFFAMMIASIGLGLIIRHVIQEIFGAKLLAYNISAKSYEFLGARITETQIAIILTSVAFIILFHIMLTRTTLGKAMRATSDNPELAMASGINIEKIILITWFIGAGIAGVAGVFRAADTRLLPTLGWEVLLPVFAVVILGGIGSFYGAVAAAYILSFAENVGVLFLAKFGPHTGYRYAISFMILILVLLIRPQGIANVKIKGERE